MQAQESPDKPAKCKICNSAFTYHSELTEHILWHISQMPNPYKILPCEPCGIQFDRLDLFYLHLARFHMMPKFECNTCKVEFGSDESLMEHVKDDHKEVKKEPLEHLDFVQNSAKIGFKTLQSSPNYPNIGYDNAGEDSGEPKLHKMPGQVARRSGIELKPEVLEPEIELIEEGQDHNAPNEIGALDLSVPNRANLVPDHGYYSVPKSVREKIKSKDIPDRIWCNFWGWDNPIHLKLFLKNFELSDHYIKFGGTTINIGKLTIDFVC